MQSVVDLRLKRVLLEQEYLDYKEDYNGIRDQQKELKDKPDEIVKYEDMLKRASIYYNRGEGYSSKGNHKTAQKMFSKADNHFEKLYEYLQEITANDISLWRYFDRTVTFDIENMPGLTPDCAPRVVTSKSHHNINKYSKTTRTQCKISAIENAILSLMYVRDNTNNTSSNKLNEFLNMDYEDD